MTRPIVTTCKEVTPYIIHPIEINIFVMSPLHYYSCNIEVRSLSNLDPFSPSVGV